MSAPINIDPLAIAIEICNKPAFKTEVLSGTYPDQGTPEDCKKGWDEKVEAIAISLLEDYPNLEKNQQEVVIGAVFSIALRMLTWIEYHIGTFNFTFDFCIEFLEPALFTSKGMIDIQGVETKMADETLSNLQRFQLACFFCQGMDIPRLFNNLSVEDRDLVYDANNPELIIQPDLIKFWSYHSMGELHKLKGNARLDQFRLKCAITTGSQFAVNYCLERTKSKQSSAVDIAVCIFRHRMRREIRSGENVNIVDDSIVFRNKRYNCKEEYWVPDNFYVDIFYSLVPDVSESQKRDFWRQIFDTRFIYSDKRINMSAYANLLDYFLCWPYHDNFLKLLKLSWDQFSVSAFSHLLLKIINRIEPKKGQFRYGEERLYDYRELFLEVWTDFPKAGKLLLFRKYGKRILQLLESIYNLNTFNEKDRRNIKSILESASEEDRSCFMLTEKGVVISMMLLERKRLDLFDELLSICFNSAHRALDYKLKLVVEKAVKMDCLEFIKNEKWDEAEEILKWSGYKWTQEEMRSLKIIFICHKDGLETCIDLWKTNLSQAENFIRWCIPPEDLIDFKRHLILSKIGQEHCRKLSITDPETADNLVNWCLQSDKNNNYKYILPDQVESICMCTKYVLKDDTPELADKFLQWCLPERIIKNYKKYLGYLKLEVFPTYDPTFVGLEECTDDDLPDKIFNWKPAERIIAWCFGSDPEEEKKFKKMFLRKSKREIIYKCIASNNWKVADRYLSFLNLDNIDLRKIKTEQICSDTETGELLSDLLSRKENDPKFAESGGKQRTIERFIHWFLVDDASIVRTFMKRLERYSDDIIVQNIITKLKMSDEIETIKGLLMAS